MTIHLHIEHLLLDGIDLPAGQEPLLQSIVATELAQLMTAGGLAPVFQAEGTYGRIQGDTLAMTNPQAQTLGPQIAGAVYGGMQK